MLYSVAYMAHTNICVFLLYFFLLLFYFPLQMLVLQQIIIIFDMAEPLYMHHVAIPITH